MIEAVRTASRKSGYSPASSSTTSHEMWPTSLKWMGQLSTSSHNASTTQRRRQFTRNRMATTLYIHFFDDREIF